MAYILMTDPTTGNVALYLENGTGGLPDDPNASRNAPLNNPVAFLDKIKLSSVLDHFEVAAFGTVTSITHAAIAGVAAPGGLNTPFSWDGTPDTHTVVNHALGYIPFAILAIGSNILWPGMFVQNTGDGGGRYATPFVDTANLGVYTDASVGATGLAALTPTYSYLVFKNPPAASGSILIDYDGTTGLLTLALNKIRTDKKYLQVTPGGSPLGFSGGGRTIDLDNGAPKAWRPDGTAYAPIPASQAAYLINQDYNGVSYAPVLGASMAWNGTYTGPPTAIQVQAP